MEQWRTKLNNVCHQVGLGTCAVQIMRSPAKIVVVVNITFIIKKYDVLNLDADCLSGLVPQLPSAATSPLFKINPRAKTAPHHHAIKDKKVELYSI